MNPLTITFDAPAPALNMNHRGWPVRWRLTKAWREATWAAAVQIPARDRKRPASWVTVVLPVPDRRRRDPHNLTPTLKAIVDGLVDAGLWPDDTPEFVTTTEPVLDVQRPRRRGDRGVVTVLVRDRDGQVPT